MKKRIITLIVMSVICVFAVNVQATEVMGVNIHGFISQGWVQTSGNSLFEDTEDGTFEFNEFGINFSKDLTDKLRLGLQLFSKDFGAVGNNMVEIDWAYGDYHFKDWLGFRAGKIKAPHGLYNETRDVDVVRTSIFLPQAVYPEVIRDTTLAITGGSVYGSFDLQQAGSLSYKVVLGSHNIEGSERKMQSLMDTVADMEVVINDTIDVDSKYACGLVWDTPMDGLRLSGTIGDTEFVAKSSVAVDMPPMFNIGDGITITFNKIEQRVYSAEYTWNDLVLATEYMVTNRDFKIMMDKGFDMGRHLIETKGYYVSSSYRFNNWFVLGAYYSKTESDSEGRGGGSASHPGRYYQKDMCFTTRYDINEYMTFKMEGHKLTGTSGLSPKDNPEHADGVRWINDWKLFTAKVTFSF